MENQEVKWMKAKAKGEVKSEKWIFGLSCLFCCGCGCGKYAEGGGRESIPLCLCCTYVYHNSLKAASTTNIGVALKPRHTQPSRYGYQYYSATSVLFGIIHKEKKGYSRAHLASVDDLLKVAEAVVEDDEFGLVGFDGFETGGQDGNGSIQFQELLVGLSESLGNSRHVSMGKKELWECKSIKRVEWSLS